MEFKWKRTIENSTPLSNIWIYYVFMWGLFICCWARRANDCICVVWICVDIILEEKVSNLIMRLNVWLFFTKHFERYKLECWMTQNDFFFFFFWRWMGGGGKIQDSPPPSKKKFGMRNNKYMTSEHSFDPKYVLFVLGQAV